jgi:hypothetical protein
MKDLAVPARGLLVRQDGPGEPLDDVVDQEGLGTVQQEERGDAPGRGVAEERGDLQVRTPRRRS